MPDAVSTSRYACSCKREINAPHLFLLLTRLHSYVYMLIVSGDVGRRLVHFLSSVLFVLLVCADMVVDRTSRVVILESPLRLYLKKPSPREDTQRSLRRIDELARQSATKGTSISRPQARARRRSVCDTGTTLE